MDLMSAKEEAAQLSAKHKNKMYVILEADGECTVNKAPLPGVIHAFKNGEEVPVLMSAGKKQKAVESTDAQPVAETKKENKSKSKNKKMSTTKKAKPAKKAAKKTKTVAKDRPAVKGANKTLTIKAMLSEIKKGNRVYRKEDSAPLPEGYLAKMKDQTREMEVTIVAAE